MKFHQAYYGATPSGHDLLDCDPSKRARFLAILDRTDLQGVPPAGVTVESYITAFRTRDDFFIMRTSPDKTAARGGMMFSHVFMSSIESIGSLHSLSPVVDALRSERPATLDVSDVECCDAGNSPNEPQPTLQAIAMANALVAKRESPAIWPDTGDFLKTVDSLWRTSWPELRAHLTFTMAISSDDAHLKDFSILYTPFKEIHRWTGYRIIAKSDRIIEIRAAATALVGGADAIALRDVAVQVCWPPAGLTDLEDLATLRLRLDQAVQDPREEIRSLRVLCHLAPAPETASSLKRRVVARAQETFHRATTEDLLACRNLRLACLSDSGPFWAIVENRVRDLYIDLDPVEKNSLGGFLAKAEKEPALSWRRAVENGLRSAFGSALEVRAKDIWQWISVAPHLAAFLFALVPETAAAEATLETSLPLIESKVAFAQILNALASRNMPRLRGKCLATFLPPDEAFEWELSVASKGSALPTLCEIYSPHTVVAEAVRTADVRLIPFAKAAIPSNTSLLLDADLESPGWQLLLKSLKASGVRFPKGDSFDRMQRQMFAAFSSDTVDNELVASLGSLGLFDLSDVADQPAIWTAIPSRMIPDFVDASLDEVVLRLAVGQLEIQDLVPQLRAQFTNRVRVMGALRKMGAGQEAQQVKLFVVLDVLTEQDFIGWYSNLMSERRPLTPSLASGLGKVIAERRWRIAAEHIGNDLTEYKRYDLAPAIPPIKSLLGFGLRFRLMLLGDFISIQDFAPHDLWEYLESVLTERFPRGPGEHALWSRAEGSDADLLTTGSGRAQWNHALRLIRDNADGSADLEKLLNEARKHYYADSSLNWLSRNWRQLAPTTKGR